MTAWAHLPNAAHIDRILASLRSTPGAWTAARGAARAAARGAARGAARAAARGAAWGAAQGAAWDAAQDAAQDAAWDAIGALIAWDAIGALIAWDDCAVYLSTPPEAFPILLSTTNHAAVLLYPAALVFTKEKL